jgi:hypothetical protein
VVSSTPMIPVQAENSISGSPKGINWKHTLNMIEKNKVGVNLFSNVLTSEQKNEMTD